MRTLARVLFLGYVMTCVLAGAWGLFMARTDMHLLLGIDLKRLALTQGASLLSQYRFLRALELGFGLFALIFRREIFSQRLYNRLFLTIMALGILGRVLSFGVDGRSNPAQYVFAALEIVAIVVIVIATRATARVVPRDTVPAR